MANATRGGSENGGCAREVPQLPQNATGAPQRPQDVADAHAARGTSGQCSASHPPEWRALWSMCAAKLNIRFPNRRTADRSRDALKHAIKISVNRDGDRFAGYVRVWWGVSNLNKRYTEMLSLTDVDNRTEICWNPLHCVSFRHAQDHGGLLESDEVEADEAGATSTRAALEQPVQNTRAGLQVSYGHLAPLIAGTSRNGSSSLDHSLLPGFLSPDIASSFENSGLCGLKWLLLDTVVVRPFLPFAGIHKRNTSLDRPYWTT